MLQFLLYTNFNFFFHNKIKKLKEISGKDEYDSKCFGKCLQTCLNI